LSGSPVLSTAAETNSPVGPYPITISAGTLSNAYYTFLFTNGTLTVTQAVLTAKAGDQTRAYGATNEPLTVSYSGFVNGQDTNILSGNPSVSTAAETNSPVGLYPITPGQGSLSLADTNYNLDFVDGTLTVTQAVLSVTADNQVRGYGAINPILTGLVVGIQNGDAIVASYSTVAETNSPVGSYEIVPNLSGAALSNYLVATNLGTLTVTQAVLRVTADSQARSYGVTNPPLTVSYCSFVNGQDTNILRGSLGLSTEAATNSPVGVYPILVSPGTLSVVDTNYSLAFTDGILTVTQAVLMVKADDQTRVYGASNAPLTVSYSGFVNGQDTNILSGGPELSTEAATNSPVGVYPIVVSPGTLSVADTNYSLVLVDGTVTVVPSNSSNTVSSSQNPSMNGREVTFTAMVGPIAPATTTPTGVVRFLNNGVELGVVGLSGGVASISAVLWTLGTNEVKAEYVGDINFLGSTGCLQQLVAAPCSSINHILSIVQNQNHTLKLTFLGTTNAQYYLLAATNLAAHMTNWTVLADSTNIATNGIWYYTVTNAGLPPYDPTNSVKRFFRAQAVTPCP
jgi:hypothetical protein